MTLYDCINQQIMPFRSHTLSDLSNAVLMNRVDTKYLVPKHKLYDLFRDIGEICSVLAIDGRRISHYKTCYFDSPDLQFYHDHHNGVLNRYKVRSRTYVDQGASYLEVKFKNNKNRTLKSRIPFSYSSAGLTVVHTQFLKDCGITRPDKLVESQICSYDRVAFARESTGERLTVDFNLEYEDIESQRKVKVKDMAIVEIKQSALNYSSALSKVLKNSQTRSLSFSKYCIGFGVLEKAVKTNRFKRTLMMIEKINRQTAERMA